MLAFGEDVYKSKMTTNRIAKNRKKIPHLHGKEEKKWTVIWLASKINTIEIDTHRKKYNLHNKLYTALKEWWILILK